MKKKNPFFIRRNKVFFFDILKKLKIRNRFYKNIIINDIQNLDIAEKRDITFFHSLKYKDLLKKTKSNVIITTSQLSKHIPKTKIKLIVNNVLIAVAKVTDYFYPNSINDQIVINNKQILKKKKYKKVNFGLNVIVGEKVKIGSNSNIGHNSIIESNVKIGKNCNIGSNVIIKNAIIGDNVNILDGAVIGKKGFGFFPKKNKNLRYPHVGMVLIGNNVEVGCNNTIDRGSLSNTIIGNNCFLDNQVHIAHNVKMGNNCIIAGQVGIAGSSILGNYVMVGGQAGISGHLKIGNNVKIAGGSGVIKNISDNSKVMGYPAKDIKKFILENK